MEDRTTQVLYTELPVLMTKTLLRPHRYTYQPYMHHLHGQPHLQTTTKTPPATIWDIRRMMTTTTTTTNNNNNNPYQRETTTTIKTTIATNDNLNNSDNNNDDDGDETHVSCLYPEILALIFKHLDVKDKGRAAQVCSTWRDAAYHKSVWRGIEAKLHLRRGVNSSSPLFISLVRRGIRRVQVLSLRRSLRDIIQGIPNIESLNLSGCYNVTDTGLSHAFVNEMPSLTELNLSLCKQVTDSSLGRIAQYAKYLETLELGGCCNITNTGLLLIAWGLRHLKRVNLRSCWHVSDQGISHLAGLNRETAGGNLALEHLGLQDCQRLTDEALKHVSNGLVALRSINLSFCVSITDSGLKHLAKMSSLCELNLRSCDNISDVGMAYLADGGSRITSLDVSFCDKIGDQALAHISQGLFNLRSLSLNACHISDDGLERIARTLHDLDTLNIGQCSRITDRGLHIVSESLTRLHSIDLYGCTRITTVGLERIMKLPQLSSLNLGLWHVSPAMDHHKKSPIRRTKRQAKVLEENFWDCSVCTFRNTAEAFKCLMCDVRKGTSTRKPRINPQLVAQQVAQQYNNSIPLTTSGSGSSTNTITTTTSSSSSNTASLQPQQNQKCQRISKKSSSISMTTTTTTTTATATATLSCTKRRHPPRLKNVDRSSAQTREVTVNSVTVVITEYKPKSMKTQNQQQQQHHETQTTTTTTAAAAAAAPATSSSSDHSESSIDAR